jgi:arylsulfatase A-like enzyme
MRNFIRAVLLLISLISVLTTKAQQKPNVVIIYVDDLGYGDLGCYGATKIKTPNLDKLAAEGLRFTNGHSSSATCTPSRYALMTGIYPWRKSGTGVLPGDAALIVPMDKMNLPKLFQQAGYKTGVVGKWHLGLGDAVAKDWNGDVKPGPNEVGFDYSFIFPATADRVPTVFLENHRVVGLDVNDPIEVDYDKKVGNDPTGKEHPELLKMKSSPDHGHDQTIVNGIGRIGYMSGGKKARWVDEEMPLTFLIKAKEFIGQNKDQSFFLFYSLTEPHVPRMPSTMFKGKSELGHRGDVILQLDWSVGQIMEQLENAGIAKNTLVIFTSDNGPVLDDGYEDEALTKQNGHNPSGSLRGGKYSAFEAGTRVPWIVHWPDQIKPGNSDALVCQVDFFASFANMLGIGVPHKVDSFNMWEALTGKSVRGREWLVQQGGALSITKDNWKYIEPRNGDAVSRLTNVELGNSQQAQLYDLSKDLGEKNNLATSHPDKLEDLKRLLEKVKAGM